MNKRIFAALLAVLLTLSLAACGAKPYDNTGSVQGENRVWYMGGNSFMHGDLNVKEVFSQIPDTVDPARIYSSVELTEQMLHGVYTLNNREKDIKTVRKQTPFADITLPTGTFNLTVLPTAVFFGAENISCSETGYKFSDYQQITDQEIAVLEFASADQYGRTPCTYQVNGNTLTFRQISATNEEGAPFSYELTGVEWRYDFTLSGPYITFTKDGSSLRLTAYCLTENVESELSLSGYSLPDSPLVQGLDYFSCSTAWNYAVDRSGSYYDQSAYKMDDAGRFSIYLAEKDLLTGEYETSVGQYAYIVQSCGNSFFTNFTLVLLDGSKVCYYTDNISDREARSLEDQGLDISQLSETDLEAIAEKKADLFDELQAEFESQGIQVTINRATGEIALDSTVLFGVNESDISDGGKAFLQKFMQVYTTVLFSEKYQGFISKILVEGHTDTSGSYELNQTLSQARADSVKDYCLSADAGLASQLQTMLESVGYAYDKPVYDNNGEVDMDASRRVSFRFVVNLESLTAS